MKRVLINLVHPNIGESRVNKLLTQTAQKEENVTINNLYAEYPDFKIVKMMLDSWKLSLKEVSIKELDNDIIRTWKNY